MIQYMKKRGGAPRTERYGGKDKTRAQLRDRVFTLRIFSGHGADEFYDADLRAMFAGAVRGGDGLRLTAILAHFHHPLFFRGRYDLDRNICRNAKIGFVCFFGGPFSVADRKRHRINTYLPGKPVKFSVLIQAPQNTVIRQCFCRQDLFPIVFAVDQRIMEYFILGSPIYKSNSFFSKKEISLVAYV